MPKRNQHPEQIARDKIDAQLHDAGWCIQDKKSLFKNHDLWLILKFHHYGYSLYIQS